MMLTVVLCSVKLRRSTTDLHAELAIRCNRMSEHNEKTETSDGKVTSAPRSVGTLHQRRAPLHWPENREFRILSIDGGGIKGIFPAAVLAELEKRYLGGKSVANYFDLIVGTSTGGVISLGLGAGLNSQELLGLYRDRGREIFPPKGKFSHALATAGQLIRYRYDREILSNVLHQYLGDKTLAQSQYRLCIPSSEGQHGEVYVFKTPHHPDYRLDAKEKLLKVALATSAAPTFFRVLEDNGYKFVDGGIWSNNPAMIALVEALSAFDVRREQIKILSLGCGSTPFKTNKRMIRLGGFAAWWKIIFAAMHFQSVTALGQAGLLIGQDRITRIDAPVADRPIGLDDWKRATTELLPAAQESVDLLGEAIASAFLTSRAEGYEPFHVSEMSDSPYSNSADDVSAEHAN